MKRNNLIFQLAGALLSFIAAIIFAYIIYKFG